MFWYKLVIGKQSKISSILYRLTKKMFEQGNTSFKWLNFIKSILDKCGYSFLWYTDVFPATEHLKFFLKQCLTDQFRQNWHTSIMESTKALNYRIFKNNFEFENYFEILSKFI